MNLDKWIVGVDDAKLAATIDNHVLIEFRSKNKGPGKTRTI